MRVIFECELCQGSTGLADPLRRSVQLETQEEPILDGRACNECTLCCKVLSIKELDKPQGQWCTHCAVGRGCKIYDERPAECGNFYCGYLTWPMTDEHWFPARCKMVIVSELDGNRVAIHVDPSRPTAWQQRPYYEEIKQWARFAAPQMRQVVVCIGNRAIVILPDEDVDLGPVANNERIITGETMEGGHLRMRAMKLHVDDPRIAGMKDGVPYGVNRRINKQSSDIA
jgi:hypothetical protein